MQQTALEFLEQDIDPFQTRMDGVDVKTRNFVLNPVVENRAQEMLNKL